MQIFRLEVEGYGVFASNKARELAKKFCKEDGYFSLYDHSSPNEDELMKPLWEKSRKSERYFFGGTIPQLKFCFGDTYWWPKMADAGVDLVEYNCQKRYVIVGREQVAFEIAKARKIAVHSPNLVIQLNFR